MGIDGLLPLIKDVTKPIHISILENKRAAIDAMSWLYRGCYACALEIYTKKETVAYLTFIYKMLKLLERWKIDAILVLDGRDLKAKERTLTVRKENKKMTKNKAFELLKQGNIPEARKVFTHCLKIRKDMIYNLIDMLKQLNIKYIVAPYEADAQISYLVKNNFADFAITEDSDLICYNCPIIVFKLSSTGECIYLNMEENRKKRAKKESLGNDSLDILFNLPAENFAIICIMAGCDYLPSIKGIGIKKAISYFDRYVKFERVIGHMRYDKHFSDKIPEGYEDAVKNILKIFQYQLVYDPNLNDIIPLSDYENSSEIIHKYGSFIGEKLTNPKEFIQGDLDFKTLTRRPTRIIDLKVVMGRKLNFPKSSTNIPTIQNEENLRMIELAYGKYKNANNLKENHNVNQVIGQGMKNLQGVSNNEYEYNDDDDGGSGGNSGNGINEDVIDELDIVNADAKQKNLENERFFEDNLNFLIDLCKEYTKDYTLEKNKTDFIKGSILQENQPSKKSLPKSTPTLTNPQTFFNPFAEKCPKKAEIMDSFDKIRLKTPNKVKSLVSNINTTTTTTTTNTINDQNKKSAFGLLTPSKVKLIIENKKRKEPESSILLNDEIKGKITPSLQSDSGKITKKFKGNEDGIVNGSQKTLAEFFKKKSLAKMQI